MMTGPRSGIGMIKIAKKGREYKKNKWRVLDARVTIYYNIIAILGRKHP